MKTGDKRFGKNDLDSWSRLSSNEFKPSHRVRIRYLPVNYANNWVL